MDGFKQNDFNNMQYGVDIEKVKDNLKSISEQGHAENVSTNYTLNGKNVKNLIKYLEFANSIGIKNIYITRLKVFVEFYDKLKDYELDFDNPETEVILKKAQQFCKDSNFSVDFPTLTKPQKKECWKTGKLSPVINFNGDIGFCYGREDVIVANILEPNFDEKWQKIYNLLNKSDDDFWCKKCFSNNDSRKFNKRN